MNTLSWLAPLATAALGLVTLAWLGIAWRLWLAQRRIPTLGPPADVPDEAPPVSWPLLTIVVPARDEAATVERAVRSLLAQDYPALEVIAVDDRSTDGTRPILERIAAEPDATRGGRLAVLHVAHLPQGWLGKTHALHLGAERARGELLLFTDADVVYAPGALRAAVAFLLTHRLGHLVVAPQLETHGYWERAFQATFAIFFALYCRLWALRRAGSRAYVGIGAFNLVRRADYDRVGGHERLALEVVDDLKLGLLLRRAGVPQGLASARDLLSVRWQTGFWASLRGLLKNAFANLDYRWTHTLAAVTALLALAVLPWAGLVAWALAWALVAIPPTPWLAVALTSAALPALLVGAAAYTTLRGSGLEGIAAPVTHAALASVLLASAALATLHGGLSWRGTRYPLAMLRRAVLRERQLPWRGTVGW